MSWPSVTASIQARVLGVFAHPQTAGSALAGFSYEPLAGGPVDFDGIWRAAHVSIDLSGADDPLSSEEPMIDAREADLPATLTHLSDVVVKKDTGDRYQVVDSQKDGEGMVRLVLNLEV